MQDLIQFCYESYKKGQLLDMTLFCAGGHLVRAQSIVMANKSDVIRDLLLNIGDLSKCSPQLDCSVFDAGIVQALVHHMYTNEFEEGCDKSQLLQAAEGLGLKEAINQLSAEKPVCSQQKTTPIKAQYVCRVCSRSFFSSRQFKRHNNCAPSDAGTVEIKDAARSLSGSDESCSRALKCETKEVHVMQDEETPSKMMPTDQKKNRDLHAFDEDFLEKCEIVSLVKREDGDSVDLTEIIVPVNKNIESEESESEEVHEDIQSESGEATADQMPEEVAEPDHEEENKPVKRKRGRPKKDAPQIKGAFKCSFCSFQTSKASYLGDHKRLKHPSALEVCNHCEKEFPRSQLRQHKLGCEARLGKEKTDVFRCELCDFTSSKARYITDHVRKVHGKEIVPCEWCKKELSRKELFKHQVRCPEKPNAEKPKYCYEADIKKNLKCPRRNCMFVAESSEERIEHAQKEHNLSIRKKKNPSKDVRPVCYHCGRSFASKTNMKAHVEVIHEGKKGKHNCDLCEYKGSTALALRSHNQHIHSRNLDGTPYERKFACSECDFKAVYLNALRSHMLKHSSLKPFACGICPYRTDRKDSLLKHKACMHSSTRKARICRVCEKSFVSVVGFRNHIMKHMGLRPYQCSVCLLTFDRLSALERHQLSKHPEGSQIMCAYCDEQLHSVAAVKEHLKSTHNMPDVKIISEKKRIGLTSFKHRFKDFDKVNEFIAGNTIETEVRVEPGTSADDSTMGQADPGPDLEMQEASEILAGIGEAKMDIVETVEVTSEPTVYEIDDQTVAIYYVK